MSNAHPTDAAVTQLHAVVAAIEQESVQVPPTPALRAARTELVEALALGTRPLDGSRFHDEHRLRSSEITRAFSWAIRAASQGPQSEVTGPEEVSLEPDVAISEAEIVRGVD